MNIRPHLTKLLGKCSLGWGIVAVLALGDLCVFRHFTRTDLEGETPAAPTIQATSPAKPPKAAEPLKPAAAPDSRMAPTSFVEPIQPIFKTRSAGLTEPCFLQKPVPSWEVSMETTPDNQTLVSRRIHSCAATAAPEEVLSTAIRWLAACKGISPRRVKDFGTDITNAVHCVLWDSARQNKGFALKGDVEPLELGVAALLQEYAGSICSSPALNDHAKIGFFEIINAYGHALNYRDATGLPINERICTQVGTFCELDKMPRSDAPTPDLYSLN